MSRNETQESCSGPEMLVPGALRGYRSWEVDRKLPWEWRDHNLDPTSLVGLSSLMDRTAWKREMVAECLPYGTCTCEACLQMREERKHSGPAPDSSCACGLYAWHRPEYFKSDPSSLPIIGYVGVVEATGRVIVGERGFRAERMRIVAVAPHLETLAFDDAGAMSRLLDARHRLSFHHDIRVFSHPYDMWAEFPPTPIDNLL